MAQSFSEHIYSSQRWKNLRQLVAEECFYICQICGKPTPSELGICHHIIPITESNVSNPNITYNKDNLIYVCRPCHYKIHRKLGIKANPHRKHNLGREVLYDENGNIVDIRDLPTE